MGPLPGLRDRDSSLRWPGPSSAHHTPVLLSYRTLDPGSLGELISSLEAEQGRETGLPLTHLLPAIVQTPLPQGETGVLGCELGEESDPSSCMPCGTHLATLAQDRRASGVERRHRRKYGQVSPCLFAVHHLPLLSGFFWAADFGFSSLRWGGHGATPWPVRPGLWAWSL